MRLKRFVFPVFIILLIGFLGWLTYINNITIEKLRSQGKDYNVGLSTVQAGKDGKSNYELAVDDGFKGSLTDWLKSLALESIPGNDGLSAYQLAQNNGFQGSVEDWIASLKGQKGDTGPAPTTDQLIQTYAIFCGDGLCRGEKGDPGINGIDAISPDRTVWACVARSVETTPAVFVTKHYEAWKYSLEPDTSYRDQFEVVAPNTCTSNQINMTGA